MKLSQIARSLSATVIGDADSDIRRIVHPADAEGPGDLAVALSQEAATALAGTAAGAVLIPPDATPPSGRAAIVYTGHERQALAILTALLDQGPTHGEGIHPTAVVAGDAVIGDGVSLGPHAVVGDASTVGDRTAILANVTVGAGVAIGRDCVIHPGVVVGDRVQIGDRVIIHANAAIGADGFSFIPVRNPDGSPGAEGMPARIHSLGTVVIGDDVEIGAATTIDRATLRATTIGRGTKIDNQVQIAHNVVIGQSCLICGQAGIAGSVTIGDRVLLGAGSGVSDHVNIASDAVLGAMGGAARSIPSGATMVGAPAVPVNEWRERYVRLLRLKSLYPAVEDLANRVKALEKSRKGE